MESPSLYRVLFLIARAFAGPSTLSPSAAGCPATHTGDKQGFTLTGNVILPFGSVPTAAIGPATADTTDEVTATEARPVSSQYAELSGTIAVSSDCSNSVTLNFYQAGQLLRTFQFSSGANGNGSGEQNGHERLRS